MITSLTSRNHQDFRQRYLRTFGYLLTESGNKKFVEVTNSGSGAVYFKAGDELEFHAVVNSGVKFEFIPVTRGWFNASDGNVYFLERVPARQWRRGICQDNTRIHNIKGFKEVVVEYTVLNSIFDPNVVNKVDHNKRPVALSQAFAINPIGTLYFFDQLIGSMKDNKIVLTNNIVKQELQDLVNRKSYPFTIEENNV